MTDEYEPIDCSLHDELEAAATKHQVCTIRFLRDGEVQTHEDIIEDVFTRGGEEFLRTASGLEIRLDDIESMNGIRFTPNEPTL